ncbi:hypothetical protein IQ07DRAFT_629994 [Pyrenochaeta sp. DS3sAY3a]|nr:hypothetical protein IQ07DRAFT_629994 [Pyrenochaeta sp. DS3sAY3a]
MTGRTFTLSALVALTQAKAIVTNQCAFPVYVWSVPQVGSSHTDNVPIKPGGRYEEPWRHGTSINPGVAIKVSPQANGIYEGGEELNFAYLVDHTDKSKIWVDLSPVRGKPFEKSISFHTCHGSYQTADVSTSHCLATDDIELVLCGAARTTPARDTTPFVKIFECYDYHHVYHEPVYAEPTSTPKYNQPQSTTHHSSQSVSSSVSKSTTTENSYYAPPKPTTAPLYHAPKPSTSSSKSYSVPSKHTSQTYYSPPKSTSKEHYTSPELTAKPYHAPPKNTTTSHYAPPKHTSQQYSSPLKSTSSTGYYTPPKPTTTIEYYAPPESTSSTKHYVPPKSTSSTEYYSQPEPTSSIRYYVPPTSTSSIEYYAQPESTSSTEYYAPPKSTSSTEYYVPPTSTSSIEYYVPPSSTSSTEYYAPPKSTSSTEYYVPPKSTSSIGYYAPPKPTSSKSRYSTPPYSTPESSSKEYYQPPQSTSHAHSSPSVHSSSKNTPPPKPTTTVYSTPKHTNGDDHHPSTTTDSYPSPTHSEEEYLSPEHTGGNHHAPIPIWDDFHHPWRPFPEEQNPYDSPSATDSKDGSAPSKPTHFTKNVEARSNEKRDCSESRCGKTIVPNHCLARVVYPSRRSASMRERNNTIADATPRTTTPLSSVLRYEAAKRNTTARSASKTTVASTLCDIARKYHPQVVNCNEEALKAYVKEIYPKLCKLDFKDLLNGSDCNQVKKEIKEAYPDVDKAVTTKTGNQPSKVSAKVEKKCILPWCEPAQPGVTCKEVELSFDERDKALGIDWTTDKEVCNKFLRARNQTIPVLSPTTGRPKVCITPFCELQGLSGKACKALEDLYEQVTKDNGAAEDYTTDDDVCDDKLAATNTTVPVAFTSMLSMAHLASTGARSEKVCVWPWCPGMTEEACEKVEVILRVAAMDAGFDIEYTDDEKVCGAS